MLINRNIKSFTYEFDSKAKMDNWGQGVLDYWNPWPKELSNDLAWLVLDEMARSDRYNPDLSNALDDIFTVRDWRKNAEKYNFSVIAGSFKSEDNAVKFAASIGKQYEDVKVLSKTDEGLYRVEIGTSSFYNIEDALELRNKVRENGIKDAWITLTSKEQDDK